ncbi:FAD-dependent oxidoreductase [Elusimicrobiota bacterium]
MDIVKEDKKFLKLTDTKLLLEMQRCEYCHDKPCMKACPVNCSPADFIMAAQRLDDSDIARSASIIMKNNPIGGICGMVCPDRHCMAECARRILDRPVNIPDIQAEIVYRAQRNRGIPGFDKIRPNGRSVAVVGSGPAGLGAASVLLRKGYKVQIFETSSRPGGMCNLIPAYRLAPEMIDMDIGFFMSLGDVKINTDCSIENAEELLVQGYDGVIICSGLWGPLSLGIEGEDAAIGAMDYLKDPSKYKFKGKVGVVGGGATALDCAVTAWLESSVPVEIFCLEKISQMPLTEKERIELFENGIEVSGRTRVDSIDTCKGKIEGITTVKVSLKGEEFDLANISDIENTSRIRRDISDLIVAIGNTGKNYEYDNEMIVYAGDCISGPATVVEAVAGGKNSAIEIDSRIMGTPKQDIISETKSTVVLNGYEPEPVKLNTDFFGRRISSPFILSAAPVTDGYDQMKLAYEAGWSGGIMKTAFDNLDIHIPSEYMHFFNSSTYGNCDNVSDHCLDTVCSQVRELVKEFPHRLTMASTGGPVTGDDKADSEVWQSNTQKLENAGAMGIEYSLSCPQGGDGTEGDIVSQNAALTAKIIGWIMEISQPDVPKLFKLSAAVTSITPIMTAIKEVLDRYPEKKAGVTLANTFPVMDFRAQKQGDWEEGVIFGMSGEGVLPISFLTLAKAVPSGIYISGNGGPMNYMQAAHFLALGARTVQFCTIVMKYGYGIFSELCSGLSHLMKNRGIASIAELTGKAWPSPITDFMDLTALKKISAVNTELCAKCGNCRRCSYIAVDVDDQGYPVADPLRCIGCSICVKKCFTGALYMRERTAEEIDQSIRR